MHDAAVLYTERGARVLRRGSQRMYGKRYSGDATGDGPGKRALKRKRDHHQDEHENLRHADGSYMTEEEQIAKVMALSDSDGTPPLAVAPTLASTPAPAPQSMARTSSLATLPPQPTLTHASAAPPAPEPAADDTPDVEVVPGPPKPPIELIDITDDQSDVTDRSLSARDVGVGNLNVEPVGDITVEPCLRASAPPRLPSHPSLLQTLRENVDHPAACGATTQRQLDGSSSAVLPLANVAPSS